MAGRTSLAPDPSASANQPASTSALHKADPGPRGARGGVGLVGQVRACVANGGFLSLWRGSAATALRVAPGAWLYFVLLDTIPVGSMLPASPAGDAALRGVVARTVPIFLLNPAAVAKTLAEASTLSSSSPPSPTVHSPPPFTVPQPAAASANIPLHPGASPPARPRFFPLLAAAVARDGPRALLRGVVPTALRDVPFTAVYLAAYNTLGRAARPLLSPLEAPGHAAPWLATNLLVAGAAGLAASAATHPFDVVKTDMQVSGRRLRAAVAAVWADAGVVGFFRGIAPRLLRRSLLPAVTWSVHDWFKLKR